MLVAFACEDKETTPTEVTLWGEVYSIENTDSLNLSASFGHNLTGIIPPEIGNLTNLTYLSLSGHNLTGSIPPEIGLLTNLTWLNLERNELTGSIPSEIGNLTNLGMLFFGNNQLTGEIPESMCNLDLCFCFGFCMTQPGCSNMPNNNLCPPYPSCIEDYVGQQDTTNCD